jgi:hypothetical protein
MFLFFHVLVQKSRSQLHGFILFIGQHMENLYMEQVPHIYVQ